MNDPHHSRFGWLNSTILGIGLASLLSDVGHEMATAVMPGLLASLGVGSAVLGLIEGLADAVASFAKLGSGWYSDRLSTAQALGRGGLLPHRLGHGQLRPGDAVVAHSAGPGRRLAGTRGPLAGPQQPAGRSHDRSDLRPGVRLRAGDGQPRRGDRSDFGPGTGGDDRHPADAGADADSRRRSSLVVWLLVRERPHTAQPHLKFWHSLGTLPHEFRRYLVGMGIAGLAGFSNTLLILWAIQAWTPRLGRTRCDAVGDGVLHRLQRRLHGLVLRQRRAGRPFSQAMGAGRGLCPSRGAGRGPEFGRLGDLAVRRGFAFAGVYMGVWETLESSTAATLLPKERRGVGFGVLATVNGIGDFASSSLVGLLWTVTPVAAMSLVAATALIGAAVILTTHPQLPRKT